MSNVLSIPASITDSVPLVVAQWLACLAMLLVIGLMILKVVKEVRGRPSAGEVEADAAERYVTKKQCDKQHEQIKQTTDHLFSKLGGVERGAASALGMEVRELRSERKHDSEILQNRLSTLEGHVSGVKTATDLQTQQLNRIDLKLDNLMNRP